MVVSSLALRHLLQLLEAAATHFTSTVQDVIQDALEVWGFLIIIHVVAGFIQVNFFFEKEAVHYLILREYIPNSIRCEDHIFMRLSYSMLIYIWLAVQVWSFEGVSSIVIILLFQVIISNSSSGLESAFKIKTIIGLLWNDILINTLPLLFESLPLRFNVGWKSFVCVFAF